MGDGGVAADDVIDLYYFSNHDTISQLRGQVFEADSVGVTITATLDGTRSFFPWTSVQRVKFVD